MKPRLIFAGTPEVAVPTLRALVAAGDNVVGVLTRPPKARGRKRTPVPSEVAEAADELGLPLLETSNPNSPEAVAWIQQREPQVGVVVAYGAILRRELLTLPQWGWVNLHFSSLPDLRGAAPVQRALMRGDRVLGCSVFQLEEGLDTGPILSAARYEVGDQMTSGEALHLLAEVGAQQVVSVVAGLADGSACPVPQDEGEGGSAITFAPKLTRDDGFVDFTGSAGAVRDQIRGVTPSPGAWTNLPDGSSLKLGPVTVSTVLNRRGPGSVVAGRRTIEVCCGDGQAVELGLVAPAGKKWMAAADWWRGARLGEDTVLGLKP